MPEHEKSQCWCGHEGLVPFGPDYGRCPQCELLVAREIPRTDLGVIRDAGSDFYGRPYWYDRQGRLHGYANIEQRARQDLLERCLHGLRTPLKYKRPPGRVLEVGCAHGAFVALLRWNGFDATGLELSPSIVDLARSTFDIPVLTGPLERQDFPPHSCDAIALMDVLEHCADPAAILRSCFELLREDGCLLVQTPNFPPGATYESVLAASDAFLSHLKPLRASVHPKQGRRGPDGSSNRRRELPVRARYFMALPSILRGMPIRAGVGEHAAELGLLSCIPNGASAAGIEENRLNIVAQLQAPKADREVIHEHSRRLKASEGERNRLWSELNQLRIQYEATEADRAARIDVIQDFARRLEAAQAGQSPMAPDLNRISSEQEQARAAQAAIIADQAQRSRDPEADDARLHVKRSELEAEKDRSGGAVGGASAQLGRREPPEGRAWGFHHLRAQIRSGISARKIAYHFFPAKAVRQRLMPFRLSIVTPSLNQARYIKDAIESVLNQEGDFEIEYFVMDGGSTDGSVEIIRHYAEQVMTGHWCRRCRSVRMFWISEKDGGQSAAINNGLRRATGEVSAFINSDDAYLPGAFSRVAQAFHRYPSAHFIHGDGDVIDHEGSLKWRWLSRPFDYHLLTSYHFLWNDFTNYIMPQSTFWRTSAHARIGLLDESLHFAMDLEYWVRSAQKGLQWRHIPYRLACFRMIPGTKSLSDPLVFWSDFLEIFRRHRGINRLPVFFAFYCFNVAKYTGAGLDSVRQEQLKLLPRWADLPEPERVLLYEQARKGFALGCYLIANEHQKHGDFKQAGAAIRRGAEEWAAAPRHPIARYCRLKQRLQGRAAAGLDSCLQQVTEIYKRNWIDYRYHRQGAPE